MSDDRDLGTVLNLLDGMYIQRNRSPRIDLEVVKALAKSPTRSDFRLEKQFSFTPNSPQEPCVLVTSRRVHTQASMLEKPVSSRRLSPEVNREHSYVSAINIELNSTMHMAIKESTPRKQFSIRTPRSRASECHQKRSHTSPSTSTSFSTVRSGTKPTSNWSSSSWTIQSRARDLLESTFTENEEVSGKPLKQISPSTRKHHVDDKKITPLNFNETGFSSALIMIQTIAAQKKIYTDAKTLAEETIQSLAMLLKHSSATFGDHFCQNLFHGIFKSIYDIDCQSTAVMTIFSDWIVDVTQTCDSIGLLMKHLDGLTSISEKAESVADLMHNQKKMLLQMQNSYNLQKVQIQELQKELEVCNQKKISAELGLLETMSQSNAAMVAGEMSSGFVSNFLYQDALSTVAKLRDDIKEVKACLIVEQTLVKDHLYSIESYKKQMASNEEVLQTITCQLNDLQMTLASRNMLIEELKQQCMDEHARNPLNPSSNIDVIMNSSIWFSKLVRSEDAFDFSCRTEFSNAKTEFSERDKCLGLLITWINKHLEGSNQDIRVSNLGRDMSSGVVFVELFRRCLGDNSYYKIKCDAASKEMDRDARLKHVADMASSLLSCPITVGSIMIAEPKTIWMITSELFNTNPTLDLCTVANLKVLSAEAIHAVRRQSLGIILSETFTSNSEATLFTSLKASSQVIAKVKRVIPEIPCNSSYSHMNPNLVVATLNELTPRWALHRLPIASLLESMSTSGGNGCLSVCVAILHRYRSQLSDIFRYYSLLGRESSTSLPSMDLDELEIFLKDTQICLESGVAERLLHVACRECSPVDSFSTADCALTLVSFLVFLIRVALDPGLTLDSSQEDTDYVVSTKLTRLVHSHICNRAIRLELVNFGNSLHHNPTIKSAFIKYKRSLEEIFCYFANIDDLATTSQNSLPTNITLESLLTSGLSISEFMGMLNSVNLFSPTLPTQAVGSIMEAIQSLSNSDLDAEDGELTFHQFVEAFLAISFFQFPDPYVPLAAKFENFAKLIIPQLLAEIPKKRRLSFHLFESAAEESCVE